MAKIPPQVIDDIREKTNIVDIVGQYVQLKKSGKNYTGLCPFHNEKTPSFSVAEDKQFYYCFGCGEGGNVFTFIQEIEGISFTEAVLKVADMENIPIDDSYRHLSTTNDDLNSVDQMLIQLHEKAVEIYHHMLVNTAAGQEALDYLHERGLTDALIEEFKIGFAPEQRDFLLRIFRNEALDENNFKETGLFVEKENGELLDRFYQRIMFPIRNAQAKTVAFSGRFLATESFRQEDQPKYLNSPETKIFNKSEVLFNYDKARASIRKSNEVYLFEGFMDVLAAYRSGLKNGIASMGTSLTNQQIASISRVTKNLILCYDGDSAGIKATDRAIRLFQENSALNLSIVSIPEKMDPDEYVQKYDEKAFVNLCEHGKETVFAFKMRYRRIDKNLSNEKEQVEYVQELLYDLLAVDSLIEQDRYLTQLSTEFQLSREILQQQFQQLKQQRQRQERSSLQDFIPSPNPKLRQPKTKVERAEELLLYRLFNDDTLNQQLKQAQVTFVHEKYQELYMLYDVYVENQGEFVLAKFLDFLKEEEMRQLTSTIAVLNVPAEGTDQEFRDLLQVIQASSLVDQINQKKLQQQEASQKGNQQLELELAIEIINLTKELKLAK